jgi:hypothetical protein
MKTPSWPFVWSLVALLIVFLEGVALGRPERGDSLSEAIWLIRYDPVGRFVLLPLWCWLTCHFVLKRAGAKPFGTGDVIGIAVGIAWAVLESRR